MLFGRYLVDSIKEGSMSDMHVDIQNAIEELIQELDAEGKPIVVEEVAEQIFKQYEAQGIDLSKFIPLAELAELADDIYQEMQAGER